MFFVEAIVKSGAGWPTIAFSVAIAVADADMTSPPTFVYLVSLNPALRARRSLFPFNSHSYAELSRQSGHTPTSVRCTDSAFKRDLRAAGRSKSAVWGRSKSTNLPQP